MMIYNDDDDDDSNGGAGHDSLALCSHSCLVRIALPSQL